MGEYELQENTIYAGDCKDVLEDFPDECVDLIYLDPPFFSNKNYEVIWEDGAEKRAFEDRWKGGINQYIEWMEKRIKPMYHVLKDTGSLYLHCDWHASHYLKVTLDEIFGRKNFQNEIIWCYSGGGQSKNRFGRKHDNLLFYSKTDDFTFNDKNVRVGYSEGGGTWRAKKEGKKMKKEIDGKVHEWKPSDEGKVPEDWWEIPFLNPMSNERLGYPTQKPKELLERIIEASSNKDDLVLDPFCGCGTTVAAADELNRNWIGIDVSPTACSVMRKRLKEQGVAPEVIGIPNTPEGLKELNWSDFQNWVVRAFHGRHSKRKTGDKRVDGYTKDGNPIQVKQSESIGRRVVDGFETAIRREKKEKGVIVAFSFSKGAWEECARVEREEDLHIEMKEVENLLEELKSKGETPSAMFAEPEAQKMVGEFNGSE